MVSKNLILTFAQKGLVTLAQAAKAVQLSRPGLLALVKRTKALNATRVSYGGVSFISWAELLKVVPAATLGLPTSAVEVVQVGKRAKPSK